MKVERLGWKKPKLLTPELIEFIRGLYSPSRIYRERWLMEALARSDPTPWPKAKRRGMK